MGFWDNLFGSKKPSRPESQGPHGEISRPDQDAPAIKVRPTPRRVLARARVLAAVVGRATLEQEVTAGHYAAQENEAIRRRVLRWIKDSGLTTELEPEEAAFLDTPVGRSSPRDTIDAAWRAEGLGVLLWALHRFELPRYDEASVEDVPVDRVGFLSPLAEADLREAPRLRSAAEIGRLASHLTIVGWRLTQFRASRDSELYQQASQDFPGRTGIQEPMDFEGYLRRHPSFQEYWLDGLRFRDGDLAIGDTSLADAPREYVKTCTSMTTERQIAAYWLQGNHELYSHVSPDTFLSAC
jgi:hypothetical protein